MEFNDFFTKIQNGKELFDYSGYHDLLFKFDNTLIHSIQFLNLDTNRLSYHYSGVYLTGYLSCPDLAFTAATILDFEGIHVVDRELINAPSLSKISEAAKLVSHNILMPKSYAGTKTAIIRALTSGKVTLDFPLIMKLADGMRGSENYTIFNKNEVFDLLDGKEDSSIWILQKYIESTGFYRINCFYGRPAYGVFRSLDDAPEDHERHLSHIYKPAGGGNATFLETQDIPRPVRLAASRASRVLKRDISGVDVIIDKHSKRAYVLEVNYNPQLVTVESFKDDRIHEFLKAIEEL
ncbi:hypothetical protein IK146_02275 [Candidatus Saccharibacteria bacterium]|nr:hypothetical protein [Candidatus Saccharibacteria bacterium]